MKFEWQDDYWAVSVGVNHLDTLREYIRNQVIHHRELDFNVEIDMMAKEWGLERIRD